MLALRDSTELSGQSLALLKMWHVVAGIYIWEFVTNLHCEWAIIRGHQTYRWTIWIYFIARWATIAFVILILIYVNVTSQINCQAWVWASWSFSLLSMNSGSLLLVLRILALWNRNKGIMAIVSIICATNFSLLLLFVIRIRAVWEPAAKSCIITNIELCEIAMVSTFVTDTVLLLIMLAGLLHLRHRGRGSHELWHLLWKQGVIWFVVAAVAELPSLVLMSLNVNAVLDMMFMFPSIITTVIATTRMHRSLQYFAPSTIITPDSNDEKTRNSRFVSKTKNPQASVVRIPSNRLEVSVHTTYEEYAMSPMKHCGPNPDKPRELDIDYKVEGYEGRVTASEEAAA
ncbi:hypothetical protein V8E52_008532 [Russula decolorans]